MLQLLLFSGLAFFLLLPLMQRTLTITLDTDWFYRGLSKWAARALSSRIKASYEQVWSGFEAGVDRLIAGLFRHHGPHGILARTWPTGSMVLWAAALLAASMMIYYFR